MLQVESNVRGAVVWVNYEEVGQVPLTRYLPAGTYTVRVAANGFDPWVRRVTLTPGMTQAMTASLVQGGGTVEFDVQPTGAKVSINGQEVGVTPIRLSSVPVGTHRYIIDKEGFEPVEGSFNLVDGGNPLIHHALESSEGRWVITSKPKGARVFMDGEEVGETPLKLSDVPSGMHTVTLLAPGYALVSRSVDTTGGLRGEVEATLSDEGTKLTVKTGASDGAVAVNGVEVGQGRSVSLIMARGNVDLGVSAPGQGEAEARVEVPLAGTLIYKADFGSGELTEIPPLYRRWVFWTAVGAGTAGVATAATLTAIALTPEPDPTGDIVITLP